LVITPDSPLKLSIIVEFSSIFKALTPSSNTLSLVTYSPDSLSIFAILLYNFTKSMALTPLSILSKEYIIFWNSTSSTLSKKIFKSDEFIISNLVFSFKSIKLSLNISFVWVNLYQDKSCNLISFIIKYFIPLIAITTFLAALPLIPVELIMFTNNLNFSNLATSEFIPIFSLP